MKQTRHVKLRVATITDNDSLQKTNSRNAEELAESAHQKCTCCIAHHCACPLLLVLARQLLLLLPPPRAHPPHEQVHGGKT